MAHRVNAVCLFKPGLRDASHPAHRDACTNGDQYSTTNDYAKPDNIHAGADANALNDPDAGAN